MENRETATSGAVPERILLIEDNDEAAFLVEAAIEKYGNGRYGLEWSKCLSEGREQLSKGGVDLVLLDLGLPDSSGPQTYESVRAVARDVPVLVLTGDGTQETESAVTGEGGVDFLVKDEVSGPLLVRAIQFSLYSSKQKRLV